MRVDVRRIIEALKPSDAKLATLLMAQTVAEIVASDTTPRSTVYKQIERLRVTLQDSALAAYSPARGAR